MINIGSLGISDMRIGTSQVLSGYVGTTLVYPTYTFYDYIAPTGTTYGNNLIYLNKQCTTTLSVDAKFRLLTYVGGNFIGFEHSSDSDDYRMFYANNRMLYFDFGSQRISKQFSAADNLIDKDLDWTLYNYGIYDNKAQADVITGTTQTYAPSLVRYRINVGSGRFYSVKMYESGVLQVDLVPAVRNSDGFVGLYDKIGGGFYTAQNPSDIGAFNLEYEYVNSIWGDGSNNYVWLNANCTTTLEMEWGGEFTSYQNNIIFGWTGSTTSDRWRLYYPGTADTYNYAFAVATTSNLNIPAASLPPNEDMVLRMGNRFVTKNGVTLVSGSTLNIGTPQPFCINMRCTKTRYLKLWDNGTLIFDGKPAVRRADGKAGLLDGVSGNFFTNGTIYYN